MFSGVQGQQPLVIRHRGLCGPGPARNRWAHEVRKKWNLFVRHYSRVIFDNLTYDTAGKLCYQTGIKLNTIKNSSQKFIIIEFHHIGNIRNNNSKVYSNNYNFLNPTSTWTDSPYIGMYHSGTANYLFCDFHVENLLKKDADTYAYWKQK